jgi:hypothetical protein
VLIFRDIPDEKPVARDGVRVATIKEAGTGSAEPAVECHLSLAYHAELRDRTPGLNQVQRSGQSPRVDARQGQGRR